ncbi:TlpA disulfide reductase family protein [Herminiimonas fonticola]|uniref:Peroxiredoxin n=1 Tax=Herminiimonas fonticola TaxID=303380 RepID=A0A4V3BW89_9BURK|nr:TlpA disulfide reductase family protein [Herminiimonas fonticola]RBA24391.1 Redoxin [Herminiimonas fonticola]TDN93508.1 peroxiredoxin [Herminiimonas fonticola]
MQTSVPASPKRRWLKLAALLIVAVLVVVGYLSVSQKETIPDVTFVNLQGKKITTQDLRGKVVMINFWATSCTTCVKEMPEMIETFKKYHAQGLEFVAVAMAYDPPNYVLNFVETRKLPFTVVLDTQGGLAKSFGDIQLTPTTLVIDKDGHIIKKYVGEPDFPALHQLLKKELAA